MGKNIKDNVNHELTHNERFPPEMFENNTTDLMKNGADLGLDPENIKTLNRERYLRNLKLLETDGMKLEIMPIQTVEMVLTAMYQNPRSFIHVINQTPEVCEYALRRDVTLLEYVHEQTEDQIRYAISKIPSSVFKVREPKEHHYIQAIELDWKIYNDIPKEDKSFELFKLSMEVSESKTYPNQRYSSTPLGYTEVDDLTTEMVEYALELNIANLLAVRGNFKVKQKWVYQFVKEKPAWIGHIHNRLDYKAIMMVVSDPELLKEVPSHDRRGSYNYGQRSGELLYTIAKMDIGFNEKMFKGIMLYPHVNFRHETWCGFHYFKNLSFMHKEDTLRDVFGGVFYLRDVPEDCWTPETIKMAYKYCKSDAFARVKNRHNIFVARWYGLLTRLGI